MDPDDAAADAPDTQPRAPYRRSVWQRAVLGFNCVVIVACFAAALGLVVAREMRDDIKAVEIASDDEAPSVTAGTVADGTIAPGATIPPLADSDAKNFLVVGVDNNSCIPPDSPYAGGFGSRTAHLSDTIMVIRVDPDTDRAAVLSFPRDMWVRIAERNVDGKINSAYQRDAPGRLVATIKQNFDIDVDHFIQVDFCAFRTIVNAIDGVDVPFEFPAKDANTGLNVPNAGCHHFDGDSGLAYVRSRHYEYLDAKGQWRDGSGDDYGRIRRQQDFLRRVLKKALDRGILDVSTSRGLINAAQDNVRTDPDLTINKMLQFLGALRDLEPEHMLTYQFEVYGKRIAGNNALLPDVDSPTMQPILALFRGKATLAPIDDSSPATTGPATTQAATTTTTAKANTTSTGRATTTVAAPTTTLPGGVIADPQQDIDRGGIVPPLDQTCS